MAKELQRDLATIAVHAYVHDEGVRHILEFMVEEEADDELWGMTLTTSGFGVLFTGPSDVDMVFIDGTNFFGEVPAVVEKHCLAHHPNAEMVLISNAHGQAQIRAIAMNSRIPFRRWHGLQLMLSETEIMSSMQFVRNHKGNL